MSTIYLARHGQTEWNQGIPRYCGVSDVELNQIGKIQARHLSERLYEANIQAIFSSPLKRALLTAQIVGESLGVPVTPEEGFREIHYGAWEGLTLAEIHSQYGEIRSRWEADPAGEKPPGGETGIEVAERVGAALRGILDLDKYENFLIVSHKTVHRLLLCATLGIDLTEYRRKFSLGNAALSALRYDRGLFLLKLHNDKCHLANISTKKGKVTEGARDRIPS